MKPYVIEIVFFSTFLIVTTLRSAALAMRKHRLAKRCASAESEELVFHEHGISAFSDNALLIGLGSHTTLEVVLTRSELWLRGGQDESGSREERLCNIVLSSIRSIRRQGKFIKIDFLGQNGMADALLLRLSDRRGFLEQLNALVLPDPVLPLPLRLFKTSRPRETSLEP